MNTHLLKNKFERIGARVKVVERPVNRWFRSAPFALDIRSDRRGEFFEIGYRPGEDMEIEVIDARPADRHLLLLVRQEGSKDKYLCGHDERHWFVAGIPESAPVGNVRQAKEALQPTEVQEAVARRHLSGKKRNRRKNTAFVRQGEWFFLPVADLTVDNALVLTSEPLQRGAGKPHYADFCYRTGGETVYVCFHHPNGMREAEYKRILSRNQQARKWNWRTMVRNPEVYVKGRIRHPDHATIALHGWHRVFMNTETESRAMRNVAFLD